MTRHITLVGAPTDIGAGVRGCGMGPDALRVARLPETLQALGLEVTDRGNLAGPPTPWDTPVGGLRHQDGVVAWNRAVFDAVAAALDAGTLPVLMGGDHCLAVGSISAVAAHCRRQGRALRVLWLDAHSDVNIPGSSPSGNLHGMPVACLLGHGPAGLTRLAGVPALEAGQIGLVGVRSVDDSEKEFVREHRIEVHDMRAIDELGMRAVMERALADVDAGTYLHVSFDMDCLDPSVAPGVGTAVRGGPTYRETQLCMEMLADSGALRSADLVELNPALDIRNQTAELAVDLLESLFGKSTLIRRGH